MRGSEFAYDSVDALYYNLNKVSLVSYRDSSKWLKNKTSTINPKSNDEKCFSMLSLLHQIIKKFKKILKEYRKVNHLLINTTGKRFSII